MSVSHDKVPSTGRNYWWLPLSLKLPNIYYTSFPLISSPFFYLNINYSLTQSRLLATSTMIAHSSLFLKSLQP